MGYVYALSDGAHRWKGTKVSTIRNEPWFDNDPFVKDRPDLFSPHPPKVRRTYGYEGVEQTTARPGEKRTTKRTARKQT